MHCPQCGQQQVSDETRFCSRCGFLLSGIAEVVANQGMIPNQKSGLTGKADSPRRRGIKQGVFLFLLVLLLAPLMGMLTLALNIEPFLVGIAVVLCVVGGLLRTVYALMFESGMTDSAMMPAQIGTVESRSALPPSRSVPASAYTSPAGSWRDTNDLQPQPGSVTDNTTKLLEKEDQ
ncbi:MAG TPA: zinc ribbon domain-containing protein [Pyrinomonadaceae bacterium]|nr:zinc ribbon domain-containing protein [Pyrinomonadaceae bacterium]